MQRYPARAWAYIWGRVLLAAAMLLPFPVAAGARAVGWLPQLAVARRRPDTAAYRAQDMARRGVVVA